MINNKVYSFVASCAAGMEALVKNEISGFKGEKVAEFTGGVTWNGSLETAYRTCLWSRFASRVFLKIAEFTISDADDLYTACRNLDWLSYLNERLSFAVSSTFGADPILSHSHYAMLRVKDGIVDYFRDKELERPNVVKEKPDINFHLYLNRELATIYLDLSGESLHRRGYRKATGIAPLKETLAAAVVALSGWSGAVSVKEALVDPMCGSATLLIEAALIWGDSAPGLSRKYYGFSKWLGHDVELWDSLVGEAIAREDAGFERKWPRLIGYDADPQMVATARANVKSAGLEDKIEIRTQEIAHLHPPGAKGYLVSNLPYGERLEEKSRIRHLYSCVGRKLRDGFQGWRIGLFVAQPDLADTLGLKVSESHRLYNGPISCRLFTGVPRASEKEGLTPRSPGRVEGPEGVDFANRLGKNLKRLRPWIQQNGIYCFRVYDRDLPEYNVAVDVYDKWIQVQEYAPPSSVDSALAEKRFATVLHQVREIFELTRDRVFIKRRSRQRGKNQYQRKEGKTKFYEVREGRCVFLVNFTNYLDTGLFLDHRPIRQKIAELASGKRFLNLYGYTGTATVHAAKGGAALSTTVDLSANYLEWAHNNLALNGFSSFNHAMVQMDCLAWLGEAREKYDLIFIDPPTFSNSKKKKLVFDIQRDHRELLLGAGKLLSPEGTMFFSTNFRGFQLDGTLKEIFKVDDITEETIPLDFKRSKKIHKCWQITGK